MSQKISRIRAAPPKAAPTATPTMAVLDKGAPLPSASDEADGEADVTVDVGRAVAVAPTEVVAVSEAGRK